MVSRAEGKWRALIGGNASTEGLEDEGSESTGVTRVDVVMIHHLQENSLTKETYQKYINDDMKPPRGKLEEWKPERVKPLISGAADQINHILVNFNNYQVFISENVNPDGMVDLPDYHKDDVTPLMIFFRDGLAV
uniref:translationally-controlled tumor protein-like n=1 Tax=Jaculus jaculus TaxID=51337 RepID=UPI001E1B4563